MTLIIFLGFTLFLGALSQASLAVFPPPARLRSRLFALDRGSVPGLAPPPGPPVPWHGSPDLRLLSLI